MTGYGQGLYGGGRYGGGDTPGVALLTHVLGVDGRLIVEMAWGADITVESALWVWTDVTRDVRIDRDRGITVRVGRADEASTTQPAACSLTFDNTDSSYSLGGQSPNWPNVRQSTPLRVTIDPGDGLGGRTAFIGYVDSFTPSWEMTGRVPTVSCSASGILRRLGQNSSPVLSSLRRRLTTEANVVAYWPLEDGSDAVYGASAIQGALPMLVTVGAAKWATSSVFAASLPLPVLDDTALDGRTPDYPHTGQWQVRVLMDFPDDGLVDGAVLLRIYTQGTYAYWELVYGTGGSLRLRAYSPRGVLLFDDGPYAFQVDGQPLRLAVEATQNGSGIDYRFVTQPVTGGAGLFIANTRTFSTLGKVTRVIVMASFNSKSLAVGHVVVQDEVTGIFDDSDELRAFAGDLITPTGGRLSRLCTENDVPYSAFGDGSTVGLATDRMGPQLPDELLNLLRAAEAVDGGILHDGTDDGLSYRTRRFRESRPPSFTIDVAAGQLGGTLAPVYDDQARVNRASVTRQEGATAVHTDTDGPLGTATVGIYDSSATVGVQSDDALPHIASWLVNKGTVDGYRHPVLNLTLTETPDLAAAWLGVGPGYRIDLLNAAAVSPEHPAPPVPLEVQGYEQTITSSRWDATINCAPQRPWAVGKLAADAADTGEFVSRLDTALSVSDEVRAVGATDLVVSTLDGPLWTTDPDDWPFEVDVGGIPITVTAVTGTSSPQTFTLDPATVTKTLPVDALVSLWQPRVLGL